VNDRYVTEKQGEHWYAHFTKQINQVGKDLVDHKHSMSQSAKWLIVMLISILTSYSGVQVVRSIQAEGNQIAIDKEQNQRDQEISAILAEIAASQARSTALLEGFINQSLERKQNTERELEQARKELDRHRNRERAHGQ